MDHAELVKREQALEAEGQKIDPRVCPRCAWGKWFYPPARCDDFPERVHQGDKIVVPKGAVVRTYAKRQVFVAGRTYRVKVNHFIGYLPRWCGESGYWTWTEDWHDGRDRLDARTDRTLETGRDRHSAPGS